MKTKGQTAIETTFVVLFVMLAIGVILTTTMAYANDIGFMASVRAAAQGAAMELSMRGTQTHVIRVDKNGTQQVDLYVMSEDCATQATSDFFNGFFREKLNLDADILPAANYHCGGKPYGGPLAIR